jgi:4a-hydroxytetrahydrobiopterin dehydratase
MEPTRHDDRTKLTRTDASAAVTGLGWRFVLGEFRTFVLTGSLPLAADVAARAAAVVLALQTAEVSWVTPHDADLARRLSAVAEEFRLSTQPGDANDTEAGPRAVQVIEIAIDAMDIASIRPFWQAVMGYAPEPGHHGAEDPLVDPVGQSPCIWFQQMDEPRPQRNRIHFDVSVPHDQVHQRIEAAVAAGGKVVYDAEAPAFWVLADAEGNEACLTIWQGRGN